MKNFLRLLIVSVIITACKSNTENTNLEDSHELVTNHSNDINSTNNEEPVLVLNEQIKKQVEEKIKDNTELPVVKQPVQPIKEQVKDLIEEPIKEEVSQPIVEQIKESVVEQVVEDTKEIDDTAAITETIKETKTPIVVSKEIFDHSLFDQILNKYVTKDGRVNYAGIKKDKKPLDTYIALIKKNTPDDTWSSQDQFAYYMNAYNAMTIDLIVSNYPTKSIKDLDDPWEQRNWKIGDKSISLEEIEHEILRKMNDPRIHFGINCASFSCPPLMNEAFTASKVNGQMEKLAKQFINDPKRNKITADRVEVSKIFRWFKGDFTKKGDLIDFLNKYSDVKINKNARVRYMDYNWELNE